jgi:NADH pyrophosphatase NudC (nudix superfamily)
VSAHRELKEEIGVETDLVFLGKHFIKLDDGRKHFIAFFRGKMQGEIKIDPQEVSKVEFFSKDQIQKMIDDGEKFHPECLFALKKYFF